MITIAYPIVSGLPQFTYIYPGTETTGGERYYWIRENIGEYSDI